MNGELASKLYLNTDFISISQFGFSTILRGSNGGHNFHFVWWIKNGPRSPNWSYLATRKCFSFSSIVALTPTCFSCLTSICNNIWNDFCKRLTPYVYSIQYELTVCLQPLATQISQTSHFLYVLQPLCEANFVLYLGRLILHMDIIFKIPILRVSDGLCVCVSV